MGNSLNIRKILKKLFSKHTEESDIFERSLEDNAISDNTPTHLYSENFVTPTLDSATEIVTDPSIEYSSVKVVCCERKRSRSVISNSLMSSLEQNTAERSNPLVRTVSQKSIIHNRNNKTAKTFKPEYSMDFGSNCHQIEKIDSTQESDVPDAEQDDKNALNYYSYIELVQNGDIYVNKVNDYIVI